MKRVDPRSTRMKRLLLSLRGNWGSKGRTQRRLPLLLTNTPSGPHLRAVRRPLLERHRLEVEHLVERDHMDGAVRPVGRGGQRVGVGGGEAPDVGGGGGALALHLLGGDGVEAAEHGVLDITGYLGAATGVAGAAREVLLEAVDAAAEEVLAAVGALEAHPALGAHHQAVLPRRVVLLRADRHHLLLLRRRRRPGCRILILLLHPPHATPSFGRRS
uniref:Uncharacterized protein n=1 Tax=Arundo donax TaxID=35708 RepID=A0A0A9E442_ARUDO